MTDFWWNIYRRFFLNMAYREKMLIGFFILSMGPLLTYAVAVYFLGWSINTLPIFVGLNFIAILIASRIFTSNLLRPLLQLATKAQTMDPETFSEEFLIETGRDEIGDLVESISRMGGALSQALGAANSIVEGLGEAMYICDTNLVVTQMNPAAAELLGYTAEELVGKHCYEFTKYGGRKAPACHTEDCSSRMVLNGKENRVRREVILVSKTGEEIPVRMNTSSLKERDGTVKGVIKLVTDLRDIKAKEREIEAIIENIGVPLIVTDLNLNITHFNPKAEELTGLSAKEVLGKKSCAKVFTGDACGTDNCTVRLMEEFGDNIEFYSERQIPGMEGRMPLYITASPLYDTHGNIRGVLQTFSDLSEMKEKEQALQMAKEYLESQVKKASSKVSSTSKSVLAYIKDMTGTSEQITETVTNIASGSSHQVELVDNGANLMKDMARQIKDVSSSARSATELAENTNSFAKKGGQAAKEAMDKIDNANDVVAMSAELVNDLGARSNQIGEIVDLITNIAEQTNLLALNAAIEAARVGEQGKGFAVVAEEVRKLAEGSARAGENIADLIVGIQEDTAEAMEAMEKGKDEVTIARNVTHHALRALEDIVEAVGEITERVEVISKAAQQQESASEKVVGAMDEIASTSEETAASTQEVAATTEQQSARMQDISFAVEELSMLANELEKTLRKFEDIG